MLLKEQAIIKYLEYKECVKVDRLDSINNIPFKNEINISESFTISYFMDVDGTPGYSRFKLKQMLCVAHIDYKDILQFIRNKKLDNLNR